VRTDDFDYPLPAEQIAQRPLAQRDASRLLLLDRETGIVTDSEFAQLPDLLRADDLLVFNNARVIPARLFGKRAGIHSQLPSRASAREHLTGTVEVFLTRELQPDIWEALVRPGRKLPVGERIIFGAGELEAEILSRGELGIRTLRFMSADGERPQKHMQRLGHVPLPP
jgi:S-adenosylmethionine:tRNA ribosyltransferase-isomerase